MMRLRNFLFPVFLILLLCITAFGQKACIAVTALSGQGVDQPTATLISDRLCTWLAEVPDFMIITPARTSALLSERGFLLSCRDEDSTCLADLGKAVNADIVIAGMIAKVGEMHTILLRVVDVASGSVITTGYQDIRYPIEQILTTWTSNAAKQLEENIKMRISRFSSLSISTVPTGATALINGREIGKTNCALKRIKPGRHYLQLVLPAYGAVQETITVEAAKHVELRYELKHTKAYSDSVYLRRHVAAMTGMRIGLGCIALAGGAAGYYFNMRASDCIDEESAAKNAYLAAGNAADFAGLYRTYQDARKSTDTALFRRNLLYGIAGACAAGFAISFWF
jgi:hypothetical protein